MNEEIETSKLEERKNGNEGWSDGWWVVLLFMVIFGFGNFENPRINELEKKVARLEGQMSMIGGRFHE